MRRRIVLQVQHPGKCLVNFFPALNFITRDHNENINWNNNQAMCINENCMKCRGEMSGEGSYVLFIICLHEN